MEKYGDRLRVERLPVRILWSRCFGLRALTNAEKRGVKVVAILDASNRTKNYSAADFLAHEGVETYVDSMHAIAHNKIMSIDGTTVLTGSFNFTKAAEETFKQTKQIRVIGYSFATADKEWLISLLRSNPNATKVIINPHAKHRFRLNRLCHFGHDGSATSEY
jgi:hypothetical protein